MDGVELSIVVIVLGGEASLERCLTVLTRQTTLGCFEILVPWDGSRGDDASLSQRFPAVQFLRLDGRRTYAELRAYGIRCSRGSIVALTEDHCIPAADWCSRILSSHRSNHAAIGGAVEKYEPDTALNWSFYFADYVRYLDPAEGPSDHLTDCNVTYKRASLEGISSIWQEEFHENVVHAALKGRSETLWLSPDILVRQQRTFNWRAALWDRYAFGRLFASTRAASIRFSTLVGHVAASPLLPLLLPMRAAAHVLRTRRYQRSFLRALPRLMALSLTWTLGELAGYLTGRPENVLSAKAREEHSWHRPSV